MSSKCFGIIGLRYHIKGNAWVETRAGSSAVGNDFYHVYFQYLSFCLPRIYSFGGFDWLVMVQRGQTNTLHIHVPTPAWLRPVSAEQLQLQLLFIVAVCL